MELAFAALLTALALAYMAAAAWNVAKRGGGAPPERREVYDDDDDGWL